VIVEWLKTFVAVLTSAIVARTDEGHVPSNDRTAGATAPVAAVAAAGDAKVGLPCSASLRASCFRAPFLRQGLVFTSTWPGRR
jgi:hypothetical protein